jgi:pimeloyl-ACP methyl ester carboxylesterase
MRETVMLLHGLWLNRLAMQFLAHKLDGEGFAAQTFGYPSMDAGLAENAATLGRAIAALPQSAGRIHLLGHSLGGLVILRYLQDATDARLGRAVLLGSPVAGSEAGARVAAHDFGRPLLGQSAALWETPQTWNLRGEVGMIAGSDQFGLAQLFVSLPGDNDGVVTIAETRVPGLADHIVLPVSHSGMLFSGAVADQAAHFLRDGTFQR